MTKYGIFLAALAIAGSASAQGALTATLQHPLASPTESVAGDVVFDCKSNNCIAQSDTSDDDSLAMCKDLARQYGPVASFGGLDGASLSKCNVVAKH